MRFFGRALGLRVGLWVVTCLGVGLSGFSARGFMVAKSCSLLLWPARAVVRGAWARRASAEPTIYLTAVFDESSALPKLWRRYGGGRRLRRGYRGFLLGLMAFGALHPYVLERGHSPDMPWVDTADDEFELVSAGVHVWVRVEGHDYDYMDGTLRRDTTYLANDFELRGTLRVRFKVTAAEVQTLHRNLEHDLGPGGPDGAYPLWSAHNCVSNVLRQVKRATGVTVPPGLNRSPTFTFGYFKVTRALGDVRVVDVVYRERLGGYKPRVRTVELMESAFSAVFLSNLALSALSDP